MRNIIAILVCVAKLHETFASLIYMMPTSKFVSELTQNWNVTETYDFEMRQWRAFANSDRGRAHHAVVTLAGLVYAIGGDVKTCPSNLPKRRISSFRLSYFSISRSSPTVDIYNSTSGEWQPAANMTTPRRHHAAVVFLDKIFVLGGACECLEAGEQQPTRTWGRPSYRHLKSVEAYDPASNKWVPKRAMLSKRSDHGVAVLGDSLYAVGGYDGNEFLNTVERYDPADDRWHAVATMNDSRGSMSVAVVREKLFAIGGHCNSKDTGWLAPIARKSVEMYDSALDTWRRVADMKLARYDAAAVVHQGLIYVFGGSQPIDVWYLDSVDVYNPSSDSWTLLHAELTPFGYWHVYGELIDSDNTTSNAFEA